MAGVMCLHFNIQEEAILEHIVAKCYLCRVQSTCRPLCKIYMQQTICGGGKAITPPFSIVMRTVDRKAMR